MSETFNNEFKDCEIESLSIDSSEDTDKDHHVRSLGLKMSSLIEGTSNLKASQLNSNNFTPMFDALLDDELISGA
jgi:hypothetical protein